MELNEFEEYTQNAEIEENLFKKIITAPKEAFRFIADHQYEKHMVQLLVLAGMTSGLDKAVEKTMAGDSGIISALIYTIIGGLFGWIGYYIFSGILSLTGRWLGGEGRTDTILPVISYAAIPTIATIPLLIVRYAIGFEPIVFDIKFVVYYVVLFIEIALSFWALALLVIGLAQVQRFSIGKAILNILLPILIIFVPILIYFFATSTTS
ncbi:Yip1 family protein [Flavobacterium sp. AG291]|uniref:Yip1 family protein n=1 Tax=Flavobacterium sp. AG291 TaxID=2184000 RepID=UPI000E0B7633|nr:Yip1 family protein [Flavobacterium sp. AG291]RDI13240.1 Yip1-like protein [Flavobacterium sp. AG291]